MVVRIKRKTAVTCTLRIFRPPKNARKHCNFPLSMRVGGLSGLQYPIQLKGLPLFTAMGEDCSQSHLLLHAQLARIGCNGR